VTGDIAAIYRQTDLVRQLPKADEQELLPESIKPSSKSPAEEMLRFCADGGATEIVRIVLERID
jgi:hypothetical protein